MTKIVLDQETLTGLRDLRERLEVCDESGHTLGYVTPAPGRSLYDTVQVPFTEEELDQAEQEPGGRTLAEIVADLEKQHPGAV